MRKLASFLLCDLKTYQIKTGSGSSEILSIGVSAIDKLKTIVNYSNEGTSLGVKGKDFKCWEVVYHMIISKEHLTEAGRLKIRLIASEMKENKK